MPRHPLRRLLVAGLTAIVLPASAAPPVAAKQSAASPVEATHAVARATTPRQGVGIAFVDLTASRGATLVGAESPACESVALHEMMRDGVDLSMQPVKTIALPAGATTRLRPGAQHLMLVHLKQQLVAGMRLPLRLAFEDADGKPFSLDVIARVEGTPHEMDDH